MEPQDHMWHLGGLDSSKSLRIHCGQRILDKFLDLRLCLLTCGTARNTVPSGHPQMSGGNNKYKAHIMTSSGASLVVQQ